MRCCLALLLVGASAYHLPPRRPPQLRLPTRRPPVLLRSRPPTAVALPSSIAPFAGLATLTSVVVIHELGHFTAARLQGIRVAEFSIGFGPPLLQRPANQSLAGISYALRALPIGGYVSFPRLINRTQLEERGLLQPGEALGDGIDDVEDGPDLLENRPLREQALVVGAGVVANIVLSWALLVAAASTLGVPMAVNSPVVVSRVLPTSAAEAAGFRAGDRLVAVGDVQLDFPGTPLAAAKPAAAKPAAAKPAAARPAAARPAKPTPAPRAPAAATPAAAPPATGSTSLDATIGAIRSAVGRGASFESVVERRGERVTLSVPPLPSSSASRAPPRLEHLPTPPDSFRLLPTPSDSFRLLLIPSDSS